MVQYISSNDGPEVPPPYDFPGMTIMSFRLPAEQSKLQALCDRFLNIGSLKDRGFQYRAAFDFVDMEVVTYPKMVFGEQPVSEWGYASQQELYFRFFVWKFLSVSGVLFPKPKPELFFPFIFVDNPWSMISGRNVIGFPKNMAQFNPTPVLDVDPLRISISTPVMEIYSPATALSWQPIVQIDPNDEPVRPPGGLWPWIGLASRISDPLLNSLLQNFLKVVPNTFSSVQLKQFRDAESPADACYQAIVSTPFTLSNIRMPKPLPSVAVTIKKYGSLDIPGSLGIPENTPLQPLLQYAVSLDMRVSGAKNLYVNR